MKKVLVFCLVLVLTLCGTFMTISAANDPAVDATQCVLRVLDVSSDGNDAWTGTAFVIAQMDGSTILVTNKHVVANNPDGVYILKDDIEGEKIKAEVYLLTEEADDGLDLVILTVDAGLENYKVLPLAEPDTVSVSDRVYALGFPGVADDITDNGGSLPSTVDDVTITSGIISKTKVVTDDFYYFQTDVSINHGNSGGPLLNEDGAVIAVNTAGAEGTNLAIYIAYIIEACKQVGIEYLPYGAATVAAGATPGTPSGPSGTAPTPSGTGASGNAASDYWWVILIIAGVIGIIVWRVKGKKSPARSTTAEVRPTAPPQAYAVPQLICTRGAFAGTTFPLNGSISMGRDPARCQIVYPDGTNGISGLHCEVVHRGPTVTVCDRGSTYGTFLADGHKLAPNENRTIATGESFYLASRDNEFKILY